jgi:predicted phosphate transport protein (TIGR00153 family)
VGFRLTPQDPSFFELFAASAQQLVAGSRELTALLGADQAERETILERVHEIEAAADEATHEIVRKVNGSFVTPFDRSDMHALAVALDTCVDLLEAAVDLIVLYQVDDLMTRVAKQVEVISRMADLTADAMPRLRSMRELDGYWIEINRLENRANKQYRRMLAELFNAKKADPLTVMKHKDIIDALEATANGFEQVALKVEAIAVRES